MADFCTFSPQWGNVAVAPLPASALTAGVTAFRWSANAEHGLACLSSHKVQASEGSSIDVDAQRRGVETSALDQSALLCALEAQTREDVTTRAFLHESSLG